MHTLWTYGGENAIKQRICMIHALCSRIQGEGNSTLRRNLRQDVQTFSEYLYDEQRDLHRILSEMEQNWDRYMDRDSRDRYYVHLTELYLSIGGHWAGVQESESSGLYTLTHMAPVEA